MDSENSKWGGFIRCPSCRSLMSTVSVQCKMCGAVLQEEDGGKEDKRSSRVRQKTVAMGAGFREFTPTEDNESNISANEEINDDFIDDPLKGYIQEIDEQNDTTGNTETSEPLEQKDYDSVKNNSDKIFVNQVQEDLPEQIETQQQIFAPKVEEPEIPQEKNNTVTEVKESTTPKPQVNNFKLGGGTGNQVVQRQVKTVTYGADAQPSAVNIVQPPKKEVTQELVAEVRKVVIPAQEVKSDYPDEEDIDSQSTERVDSTDIFKEVINNTKVNNMANEISYNAGTGKLFGWLVSYSSQEGRAYELRESKFFMSGKALKANDFIIDNSSVSTPHAMVSVTRAGGFMIQDLMSDRGVFIRRKGQETYQKEDGIIKCLSGDWIRLGDVEYLLTIVADLK